MVSSELPRRGEVWLTSLGAGRPGEPGKTRPAIVVSVDELTAGASADLVVVVPLSRSAAPSDLRVEVAPGTSGVEDQSRAVCRAVRSVIVSRLVRQIGRVTPAEMDRVEAAMALILGLDSRPSPG